jgi:sec-independent protein translocase protein TatA
MSTFPSFIAGFLGLGGPEVLLIFAVLLLLFGGSKLPELAKGLGKSIKEFKHASREDAEPAQTANSHSTVAPPTKVTERAP